MIKWSECFPSTSQRLCRHYKNNCISDAYEVCPVARKTGYIKCIGTPMSKYDYLQTCEYNDVINKLKIVKKDIKIFFQDEVFNG